MVHNGAVIERAVRRSGVSIAELARKIQVDRRTLYNWFSQDKLSKHAIFIVGRAIDYDFSEEIPELLSDPGFNIASVEEQATNESVNEGSSITFWKNKYILLLEKYSELLQQEKLMHKDKQG